MTLVQVDQKVYLAAESGDLASINNLESVYTGLPPTANRWAVWLLMRSLLLGSRRHETPSSQFSLKSAPESALRVRQKAIETAETWTPDSLIYSGNCSTCGAEASSLVVFQGEAPFTNNYSFVCEALRKAQFVSQKSKLDCGKCNASFAPTVVDYHNRMKSGVDLVVRSYFDAHSPRTMHFGVLCYQNKRYTFLKATEFSITETLSDLLKRTLHLLQDGERVWASAVVRAARNLYPANPLLMEVVKYFDRPEERGLREALLSDHLAKYPDDPTANFLYADMLMRLYVEDPVTRDLLAEASFHCTKSIDAANAVRKPYREAGLLDCTITRLQNQPRAILQKKYMRLVTLFPDFADAYYDYGLYVLEYDAKTAAQLFETGSKLRPTDPEFLVAKARALYDDGQRSQASAEYNRAKMIDSDHPSVLKYERLFRLV